MAPQTFRFPQRETKYVTLDKYVTVEEAATLLGLTSTRIRQLITDKRFKTVATVGSRPLYLLERREVEAMAQA